MSNEIDISIIYHGNKVNKSVIDAVIYCNDRGIKCELVERETMAKGEFVCHMNQNVYYNDYFLHYQYTRLFFFKFDKVAFAYITVYDSNSDSFYIAKYHTQTNFYRRGKDSSIYTYIEDDISPGFTTEELEIVDDNVEPETIKVYREYIAKNF